MWWWFCSFGENNLEYPLIFHTANFCFFCWPPDFTTMEKSLPKTATLTGKGQKAQARRGEREGERKELCYRPRRRGGEGSGAEWKKEKHVSSAIEQEAMSFRVPMEGVERVELPLPIQRGPPKCPTYTNPSFTNGKKDLTLVQRNLLHTYVYRSSTVLITDVCVCVWSESCWLTSDVWIFFCLSSISLSPSPNFFFATFCADVRIFFTSQLTEFLMNGEGRRKEEEKGGQKSGCCWAVVLFPQIKFRGHQGQNSRSCTYALGGVVEFGLRGRSFRRLQMGLQAVRKREKDRFFVSATAAAMDKGKEEEREREAPPLTYHDTSRHVN